MSRVLIPLAEGCEEIEAVTLIDLLRRASIEVVVAGLKPGPVQCSRNIRIIPDIEIGAILGENFDMIVLPGGAQGAEHLYADQRIQELLVKTVENGGKVAAICAAPKVLAQAGLLKGRRATSYPGVLEEESGGAIITHNPVETDGPILTSRGPGTAMDFAMELIEQLTNHATRVHVEAALQRP